jgi:hypothetical protein
MRRAIVLHNRDELQCLDCGHLVQAVSVRELGIARDCKRGMQGDSEERGVFVKLAEDAQVCISLQNATRVLSCLLLGERSPLGRAAALLAGCPPPTTSTMDLQCGADRHPSSPFALSGSSVGQRGIFGL